MLLTRGDASGEERRNLHFADFHREKKKTKKNN